MEPPMKSILILSLFCLPLASFAAEEEGDRAQCFAQVKYLDGLQMSSVVDCGGPYDGKCLEEVKGKKAGTTDWKEVSCEK